VNESYLAEGAVKEFEMAIKNLINNIRRGYGWIDPEYVYDTVVNSSDFDRFEWETIKDEVYQRLIDNNLLYYANDADPKTKGKKVSNVSQIQESKVNEANDEFVPATLTEDIEDLKKGGVVKVNALQYSKRGDDENVESIRPDGKKMEIKKKSLTVKI
jgi:hypothetical protein